MAGKHTRLRLLDTFSCTGAECSASCCSAGWDIDVDDETLEKWQGLDADSNEFGLLESITSKQDSNKKYLKQIDNQCIHFSVEGLCKIQLKFGHEYLPKTCQEYPRISWYFEKYRVDSLNLSCPEVAKLLLRENNENLFEINKKAKIKHTILDNPTIPEEMASLLEGYVSQVMRNNKYPINILLLTIAKKIVDIVLLSQQGKLGIRELQAELKDVPKQLKATQQGVEQELFKDSSENSARFWRLVFALFKVSKTLPGELEKYREEILEKIEGQDNQAKPSEDFISKFMIFRNGFYSNVPGFYRDLMSRYLKVKFINNAFPRSPVEGNLVAGLLHCVIPYALMQLSVWVAAEYKSQLAEQDIVEIMYKVERKLDHTEWIYKFLGEHPELLRIDTYYGSLADV